MTVTFKQGDCRDVLASLPAQSVHCCVTSPPYFGLRDYGTAQWDGGDPDCDHIIGEIRTGLGMAALGAQYRGGGHKATEPKPMTAKHECPHCGATRIDSQIGLEATPADYVAELVAVFREVRRVLRDDGTLWLNLGDSYAANRTYQVCDNKHIDVGNNMSMTVPLGLKPKDLIGIPWRVAFALQADGWYLRQDIIWSKPNPMPESVTDRCTKAHEYIFLMSKSARYFYDADAIKEPASENTHAGYASNGAKSKLNETEFGVRPSHFDGYRPTHRNRRSVWEVASQPFAQAHFATFPPNLIEPCILAGCPKGGVVLDPFGGAGTTGLVADRLQRDALLIELNPAYAAMAENRFCDDAGMFAAIGE